MKMHWLNTHGWIALTEALLHTLWQGALVAAGLWVVLRFVPARWANLRYSLSAAALMLILVAGVAGWAILDVPSAKVFSKTAVQSGHQSLPAAATTKSNNSKERPVTVQASGAKSALPSDPQRWWRYATWMWLAGASCMLLRAFRGVIGEGRLRRRAEAVGDEESLQMMKRICERLGVTRRVRLLASPDVVFPAVLGVLEPAILLPSGFLLQCPARDLRAILAHELAHIRRWDYLTNLGQLLIEALLFFNPFVWWISRQMRIEREACCDLIAAEECESTGVYVEVLLGMAEAQRAANSMAPALAMAGPSGAGRDHLLDRSRRLLVPGYMPALRLRWFSLCLILGVAGVGLSSFWTASRAVAQTVVETISDHQRVLAVTTDPAIESKITIRLEDGRAASLEEAKVESHMAIGQFHASGNRVPVGENGVVSVRYYPRAESVTIAAFQPGYATTFAGPFKAPLKESIDGLNITLTKGTTGQIRIVDELDQPIAGAKVEAFYPGPPHIIMTEGIVANAEGLLTLEHLGSSPLNASVWADGFQTDEIAGIRFDRQRPFTWKLKTAVPFGGVVRDRASGQPIEGAIIKLAGIRGAQTVSNADPKDAPRLGMTDQQGHFRLTSLRANCTYQLFVEAPGHGGALVDEVRAGEAGLEVALGPEIMVRGKFIHVAESAATNGRYHFGYGQSFKIGNGYHESGNSKELKPKDGEAEFEIGPLYAWPVNIRMGKKEVQLEVSELLKTDLVIDLAQ